MIRISVTDENNVPCFKVEGRLVGYGVDELRRAILRRELHHEFQVDISGVTFVDEDGEKLIIWIDRMGGRFRNGVFSTFLLERLGITAAAQERARTHRLALRMHSGAALCDVPQADTATGR